MGEGGGGEGQFGIVSVNPDRQVSNSQTVHFNFYIYHFGAFPFQFDYFFVEFGDFLKFWGNQEIQDGPHFEIVSCDVITSIY